MSVFEQALILTGPTACGKSALALDLAERIGGEIVALDSMTVYRGMDIGTAKPPAADRVRVPHHLIDVLDPWESLTVASWLERAELACTDITARGKRPIFVGGTPFYLKALLHGLFPGPPADEELRRTLEAEAARDGNSAIHAKLALVDAKTAARLHPNDVRRVVRALEVHALTGKPISSWQQTWDTPAFTDEPHAAPPPARIPTVKLDIPRETLYDRINQRVTRMLEAGWVNEVQRLCELPHPLSREARQALGYRELLEYLATGGNWDETVDLIRTHTRQFAKRQLTWFRGMSSCVAVPADAPDLADRVLKAWGANMMSP
ncbi:tRNA (adenosine(37)-N6)-dimethylallyltransferase MiaA [Gemmata sp. G18]|uniref:tRNA dimethylallyltransferase n=1 Tax=Gemmata palustris TaxID=2822762 RepID=A0ABS5C4X3_9BACT|nr:tRNA (adenosine(37)-N6)-dimethylallyltransferase MiaA [Gemmata palustris]MBP3960193.1 tRNA (adenosine(37)-N6)-dimethylallyltransferase MiaA [Gemmata palustris]